MSFFSHFFSSFFSHQFSRRDSPQWEAIKQLLSCRSLFLFPFSTFPLVFLHPTHRWGSLALARRGLRSLRIRESETEKIRFRRRAFELPFEDNDENRNIVFLCKCLPTILSCLSNVSDKNCCDINHNCIFNLLNYNKRFCLFLYVIKYYYANLHILEGIYNVISRCYSYWKTILLIIMFE